MTRLGLRLGAVAILLASCGQLAEQSELDESLTTWNALKAENGDYYRYEVSAGSVVGPHYDTTLTVQEGEVVQRDLAIAEIDDEGNVTVTERWSETGAALDTHDEGAELITLDERYSRCRDDVLNQDPTTNDIYLEFQDNSVLASCYAIPKNVDYDGGAEVITGLEFSPFKND